MTGLLRAVCRVAAVHPDDGKVGFTAIDKHPIQGPVRIESSGVEGDRQCDLEHHGGPDQALLAYSQDEARYWESELGMTLPFGHLGENLRIAEMDIDSAEIGEMWQIGEAVFEVTSHRTPCQTFGRWLGQESWPKRFNARGRNGVYLRVLRPGLIEAGQQVEVIDQPGHGVQLRAWAAEPSLPMALALDASERTARPGEGVPAWRLAKKVRARVDALIAAQ